MRHRGKDARTIGTLSCHCLVLNFRHVQQRRNASYWADRVRLGLPTALRSKLTGGAGPLTALERSQTRLNH